MFVCDRNMYCIFMKIENKSCPASVQCRRQHLLPKDDSIFLQDRLQPFPWMNWTKLGNGASLGKTGPLITLCSQYFNKMVYF